MPAQRRATAGLFTWPCCSMVELRPGDRLLLFTDWITEAASPEGEQFGEERMLAVMARLE